MSAGSGLPSRGPFASYDPGSRSWRMSQGTFPWGSDEFSATWPRRGTTRSGLAYELPMQARRTDGNVSSSPPGLLPTPMTINRTSEKAQTGRPTSGPQRGGASYGLEDVLLKTPTAQLAVNGGSQHPDKRRAGGHGPTLADQVEHLLPTPRATDGTKGGPNQRGSSGDLMLPSAVQHLLPTPNATDWKGSGQTQGRARDGKLRTAGDADLPEAVALLPTPRAQNAEDRNSKIWARPLDQPQNLENALARLPGEPTVPLLPDGRPSSDVPRQAQLSLGEPDSDFLPDL
jgi:hypothetical protein